MEPIQPGPLPMQWDDPPEEMTLSQRKVLNWRIDVFQKELGFSAIDAVALATSRVDLWDARRLHAKGCPPYLAVKILL